MDNEYHNLGNSLQECGRFNEAAAAYQQAVELHPDSSWSYHSLGDVFVKLQRWEEAVVAYNKAVELNPEFSWSYHNLGDVLLKLEQWEKAATAYRREIELKSDFPWSFSNLGDALIQLEKWDEAINVYIKAIVIDRDLPGIYEKLGYALRQTESDLNSVFQQCQLPLVPENREFYLDLGRSLARCDRPKSAIIFCKLLLTNEPNCDMWTAQLGEFLQEQEECDGALASCREIVAQKPDDCWSYYNLGAVLSHQKKWDEAAVSFLKAIEINPDIPWWFYYNLWEVLAKQNKLEEVENLCKKVVVAKPDAFWPYLNLGEVLTRQNKITNAIDCYRTVSFRQTFANLVAKKQPNWNLKLVNAPNFIIIGSQRCGTTSLYTYLAQHPQILTPIKKEMDFFSWHFDRGIDWYLAHFPPMPVGEPFLTGEASPSYFDSLEAPQRLYRAFPEVKLVVLLRNPVDRAISQFYRLTELNWEVRSCDRAISDEIARLNQNPAYIIGEEPGNYLARGRYIEFIENWLDFFPKEQLLIVKSEDFYAGAATTVKQVLKFLDLPEYQLPEYQNANPGYYQPISDSVRDRLSDYFRPYNQHLEEYLDQKFDWA